MRDNNPVFLRVLEYYTGIIFLTTNRVGNIDEAFKSRIHISLYYPALNSQQNQRIWHMNLERLDRIEEERSKMSGERRLTIAKKEIYNFAKHSFRFEGLRWNGRQIRNAFLIASALARFDKHKTGDSTQMPGQADITVEHFKTVVKAGTGFDHYLHETKGKSDGELAYEDRIRADYIQHPYQKKQASCPASSFECQPSDHYQDLPQDHSRSQPMYSASPRGHYMDPGMQYSYPDEPRYISEKYSQGQGAPPVIIAGKNEEMVGFPPYMNAMPEQRSPQRMRTPQPQQMLHRPPGYGQLLVPMGVGAETAGWQQGELPSQDDNDPY